MLNDTWKFISAVSFLLGLIAVFGRVLIKRRERRQSLAVATQRLHMENVLRKVNELNSFRECDETPRAMTG